MSKTIKEIALEAFIGGITNAIYTGLRKWLIKYVKD